MEATVTLSVITAAAAGLHASSGACGYLSAAGADVADDEASFLKYRASLRIAGGALLYAGGRTGVAAAPPVALLGGAFAFAAAIPGFARLGGPMTLEGLSLLSLLLLGGLSLKGMVPFEDAFGMAVSVFTGVGFQWLVLPGFSVGLYKFATTVSADAITRAAQCGGTLLCGGVYMLLLRGKGHVAGLVAYLGLSAALAFRHARHSNPLAGHPAQHASHHRRLVRRPLVFRQPGGRKSGDGSLLWAGANVALALGALLCCCV